MNSDRKVEHTHKTNWWKCSEYENIFHLLKLISVSVINFSRLTANQPNASSSYVAFTRLRVIFGANGQRRGWLMCVIYASKNPVARNCKFSLRANWNRCKKGTRAPGKMSSGVDFFFHFCCDFRVNTKHLIDLWYAVVSSVPNPVSLRVSFIWRVSILCVCCRWHWEWGKYSQNGWHRWRELRCTLFSGFNHATLPASKWNFYWLLVATFFGRMLPAMLLLTIHLHKTSNRSFVHLKNCLRKCHRHWCVSLHASNCLCALESLVYMNWWCFCWLPWMPWLPPQA